MDKPATEMAEDLHKVSTMSEKDLEAKNPTVFKGELADDPDAGLSEEEKAKIVSLPFPFPCMLCMYLRVQADG